MRSSSLGGEVILRIIYEDGSGNLIDPTNTPQVWVYDPSLDENQIELDLDSQTMTGDGPHTPTRISTGYYELVYSVPSGGQVGVWNDVWVADDEVEVFTFQVAEKLKSRIQVIGKNSLIVIELDGSIASLDGEQLGEDVVLTFSTEYDPLYASVDLVRAEVGPWIDFIPDDTINLLIHWASKEADLITPRSIGRLSGQTLGTGFRHTKILKGKNLEMYRYARTQYVIYDVACRALTLPAASNAGNIAGSGGMKRLGDLLVRESGGGIEGKGLTWKQIEEMKAQREEWKRVVNSGGTLMPGQSIGPTIAVQGIGDPDRPPLGRGWEDPSVSHYAQPTVNGKVRRAGYRKFKKTFRGS